MVSGQPEGFFPPVGDVREGQKRVGTPLSKKKPLHRHRLEEPHGSGSRWLAAVLGAVFEGSPASRALME